MPTRTSSHSLNYTYSYSIEADGVDGGIVTPRTNRYTVNDFVNNSPGLKGWRQLIASGGNATTSAYGEKWEASFVPTVLNHWLQYKFTTPPIGSRRTKLNGNLLFLGVPNFNLDMASVSANNQALTRFYGNLSKQETAFKGMVFAGELRESLNMIKRPSVALFRGVGDYLSFLRRIRKKISKRQRLDTVREAWLEYSFGWKPLISDIDAGIKAFYSSKLVRPIFTMVSAGGKDETSLISFGELLDVGSGYHFTYNILNREEVNVRYQGIYDSTGAGVSDSHHYGFRPSEFVPTLWELLPYSFLVDYFTNIGDIVSSWSYRFIGTRWCSRTVRRSASQQTIDQRHYWNTALSEDLYNHGIDASVPGFVFIRKTSFQRTPQVVLDIPKFEIQCPGMGSKWVNIIALAAGLKSARKAMAR